MGKIDSWITKLPRLKNSKVARFSYKAEAYANDDIEGVENYDYSRDMNIPSATHTDFDPDVLSIGARSNFSSIPKNGLNHFFGRVSYNLNKAIDFLSDFLDDFIALNNSFISFTETVSFSSSATLSNYANGSTKRLLNTAGSTITITLPAGETYLGSNTILLTPSIMLTITKRGTVWVNSSGTAITALTANKWKTARNVTISDADGTNTGVAVPVDGSENETLKLPSTIKATLAGKSKDSYPIPTDAVLQYSFDEIKQLPDNPAGTVYKRDNDWTITDGWTAFGSPAACVVSVEDTKLKLVASGSYSLMTIRKTIPSNAKISIFKLLYDADIVSIQYYNNATFSYVPYTLIRDGDYYIAMGYVNNTGASHYLNILYPSAEIQATKTQYIETIYIGDGSYIDPVIDNSYNEAHAENHGVIPVDGVCGKAGYFNNSYMIAPRPALGDDITIYFWVKLDKLETGTVPRTILQSRTASESTGLSIYQSLSVYRFIWRGDTSFFSDYYPPVNTWHHVCMKMNATTKVLKINGETKVTLTGTYGVTENLASTIWSGMSGTGGTPNGNSLTGALDGLKIVPRFTTDDEDIGEYKARANLPKFYATADKWKTARNITISDADGTNTGTAVSVDGSENENLKLPSTIKATLSGNATTATLATQANAIKPLGNSITLSATSTSVTKIIKIATVNWSYTGTINIRSSGTNIVDEVKIYIGGGNPESSGVRVVYGKNNPTWGIKKIVVTRDSSAWDTNRQIYAEIVTFANNTSTTILGVVETYNDGTFTPSMTEVSSVAGTVVDSLSLSYQRGDISSYNHVFTNDIIGNVTGNVTGNAGTADKWKTARNITISDADGTNTGTAVSVDGSENETLKLPPTIKANLTGNVTGNTFNCLANESGDISITTAIGSLPGYPGNYYPTIKTSNSDLYFGLGNAYAFGLGSAGGTTTLRAGTNTKLSSSSPFYGAVGNDICDNIKIESPVKDFEYGYCYCEDKGEYKKGNRGIIGITSDTASLHCGSDDGMEAGKDYLPIAIGGFVLVYVDKKYRRGTPLKAKKDGSLTRAYWFTPCWKIIATYQEEPREETWNKATVNGRVIVRVK